MNYLFLCRVQNNAPRDHCNYLLTTFTAFRDFRSLGLFHPLSEKPPLCAIVFFLLLGILRMRIYF